MACVNQTFGGVQPSEAASGNQKVVVHQESERNGKSKLVFDVHHSQQQCAPPEEDNIKETGSSMVCHLPKDVKTAQMSTDSKGTAPHVHPNRGSHTYFSSIIFYLFFIANHWKSLIYGLLFLSFFLSSVRGEKYCDNALTADDVGNKASKDLHFHNGGYKEIEDDALANASVAEHLDLSFNCLETVPKYAFDNLTNVHSINMGYNRFTDYPLALQKPDTLNKLKDLKFDENFISYLEENFFKWKSTIQHLNFSKNVIGIIHDKALDPMLALIKASFSRNKLTSLPLLNLTHMQNLAHIDFCYNYLETLQIWHYSSLPEVTSISITDEIMSVNMGTKRVVVFVIDGNSETISCEDNEQDILRSNVVVNFTISCMDRNGTRQVLRGLNLPQNGTTTVMSYVIGESTLMPDVIGESTQMSNVTGECTALHTIRERNLIHANVVLSVFLVLFVALFIFAVVVIIFFVLERKRTCQHITLKCLFGQERRRMDPNALPV